MWGRYDDNCKTTTIRLSWALNITIYNNINILPIPTAQGEPADEARLSSLSITSQWSSCRLMHARTQRSTCIPVRVVWVVIVSIVGAGVAVEGCRVMLHTAVQRVVWVRARTSRLFKNLVALVSDGRHTGIFFSAHLRRALTRFHWMFFKVGFNPPKSGQKYWLFDILQCSNSITYSN